MTGPARASTPTPLSQCVRSLLERKMKQTVRHHMSLTHTSAVVARDQIVVRDLLMVGDSVSVHSHTAVLCKWHHVDHCSIGDVLYYVHGHVWYCNRNVTAQLISDEYLNTLFGVPY